MIERIKSWESPRKRGRNKKGKGGAARARQLRKREKLLRKKLKHNLNQSKPNEQEKDFDPSLFLWILLNTESVKKSNNLSYRTAKS